METLEPFFPPEADEPPDDSIPKVDFFTSPLMPTGSSSKCRSHNVVHSLIGDIAHEEAPVGKKQANGGYSHVIFSGSVFTIQELEQFVDAVNDKLRQHQADPIQIIHGETMYCLGISKHVWTFCLADYKNPNPFQNPVENAFDEGDDEDED